MVAEDEDLADHEAGHHERDYVSGTEDVDYG